MSKKNDTLLSTNELAIGYGQHTLLANLNLTLKPGELVCFMGVNGIGKSSLIRSLAGLQKILSGTILYSGKPADKDLPTKLSVVLTDKTGAPTMTAYELIAFGRYPYMRWDLQLTTIDKQIIERSIEQVSINHLRDKKFHELSDGQQQLVMIARALAQDSGIILLDEPTAHLDLNNKVEIMNLLRRICRSSGKGIVVATHELDLALQTADTVWLASNDKKILTGIPEDLVLNGSFDNVFGFKGYDLKTGTVEHVPHLNRKLSLTGNGPLYHWTKRALERAGYQIVTDSDCTVLAIENEKPYWIIKLAQRETQANTLREVLGILSQA